MSERECLTCVHFTRRLDLFESMGQCRRFPPLLDIRNVSVHPNRMWPTVYNSDCCGEHTPGRAPLEDEI